MEDMKLLMAQATDNFLEIEHRTVVTQISYKSYMWYNKCSKYLLLMIILLLRLSMLREAQDHGTTTVVVNNNNSIEDIKRRRPTSRRRSAIIATTAEAVRRRQQNTAEDGKTAGLDRTGQVDLDQARSRGICA